VFTTDSVLETKMDAGNKRKAETFNSRVTSQNSSNSSFIAIDGGSTTFKMITPKGVVGFENTSMELKNGHVIELTSNEKKRLHRVNINSIYAAGGDVFKEWSDLVDKLSPFFTFKDVSAERNDIVMGIKKKSLIRLGVFSDGGDDDGQIKDFLLSSLPEDCNFKLGTAMIPLHDQESEYDPMVGNGVQSLFWQVKFKNTDKVADINEGVNDKVVISYDFLHILYVRVNLMEFSDEVGVANDIAVFGYPDYLTTNERYVKYWTIYRLAIPEIVSSRIIGLPESYFASLGSVVDLAINKKITSDKFDLISVEFGGEFTFICEAVVVTGDQVRTTVHSKKFSIPVGQQIVLYDIIDKAFTFDNEEDRAFIMSPTKCHGFSICLAKFMQGNRDWQKIFKNIFKKEVPDAAWLIPYPMRVLFDGRRISGRIDPIEVINVVTNFLAHVFSVIHQNDVANITQDHSNVQMVFRGMCTSLKWWQYVAGAFVSQLGYKDAMYGEYTQPAHYMGMPGFMNHSLLRGMKYFCESNFGCRIDGDLKVDTGCPIKMTSTVGVKRIVLSGLRQNPGTRRVSRIMGEYYYKRSIQSGNQVHIPEGIMFFLVCIDMDTRTLITSPVDKARGVTKSISRIEYLKQAVEFSKQVAQLPYVLDEAKPDGNAVAVIAVNIESAGQYRVSYEYDKLTIQNETVGKIHIPVYDERVILLSDDLVGWQRFYMKLRMATANMDDASREWILRKLFYEDLLVKSFLRNGPSVENWFHRLEAFFFFTGDENMPREAFLTSAKLNFKVNRADCNTKSKKCPFHIAENEKTDQFEEWLLKSSSFKSLELFSK
jgi:hypothetical protein